MLPLVDGDNLVDQGVKGFFLSDGSESVFDCVFKTEVKQKMLGVVVEVQGRDDLLEFDRIGSGRLGLLEVRQLVSRLVLEVAVKIKGIKGLLESRKIVTIRMCFILENYASPIASVARKVRDDEQDLLLVVAVRARTHREREETLRHECAILRDFAAELVGFVNLRFATRFGCRGVRVSALEAGDDCMLIPDFSACFFECLHGACKSAFRV